MSFSYEIKEELSKTINYKNKALLEAQLLGYFLAKNSTKKDSEIEFITENEFNIEVMYKILFNLDISYEAEVKGKCYVADILITEKVEKIFELVNSNDEQFLKSIVKGAFLSSGSVNEPDNKYHLEISFNTIENAKYIKNICEEFGIELKLLEDSNKLYIKDGEEISKFLALIGANSSVLKFEDIRVIREMKNNVNRLVNCETANINKTVNAAVDQINDINLIKKRKKFDEMPEELREIADLRLNNPHSTLKELGEMLDKPLGKSGVNHRIQRIHEIAEELRK